MEQNTTGTNGTGKGKELERLMEHIKEQYKSDKVNPLPEGTNPEGVVKILDSALEILKNHR